MARFDGLARTVRRALVFDSVEPNFGAGVRMTVIVVVPLAIALVTDRLDIGLLSTLGALNVALADPGGPRRVRASATITASIVTTIAIALATLVAGAPWLAVTVVVMWTFALSLAANLEPWLHGVAFVGSIVLVVGLGLPDEPSEVVFRLVSFAAGCGWAVLVTVSVWPLRPDATARDGLAHAFRLMAEFLRSAPHGDRPRSAGRDEIAVVLRSARRAVTHRGAVSHRTETVSLFAAADVVERSLGALDRALAAAPDQVPSELTAAVAAVASTCDGLADSAESLVRRDTGELSAAIDRLDRVTLHGEAAVARNALAMIERGLTERSAGTEPAGPQESARQQVRGVVDPGSIAFRFSIRLALTVGVAQALVVADPFDKGYWIPLTVVVVLQPDVGSTVDRAIQRTIGTVIGALITLGVISTVDRYEWVLAVLFGACVFWMASLLEANYTLGVIGLTPAVMLLLVIDGGGSALVLDRIGGTLVGGALALIGALALWPLWARRTLPGELRSAASAAEHYLDVVDDIADAAVVQEAHRRAERARSDAEALQRRMLSEPRRGRVAPIEVATYCDGLDALVESTTQLRTTWLAHEGAPRSVRSGATVAPEDAVSPARHRLHTLVDEVFGADPDRDPTTDSDAANHGPDDANRERNDGDGGDDGDDDTYQLIVGRIDAGSAAMLNAGRRIVAELDRQHRVG